MSLGNTREPSLCLVAFQSEAFEAAARALEGMVGWTFEVYPAEGAMFTATLRRLEVSDEDGQYKAIFALWEDDCGFIDLNIDEAEHRRLDIFDEIDRMEVI